MHSLSRLVSSCLSPEEEIGSVQSLSPFVVRSLKQTLRRVFSSPLSLLPRLLLIHCYCMDDRACVPSIESFNLSGQPHNTISRTYPLYLFYSSSSYKDSRVLRHSSLESLLVIPFSSPLTPTAALELPKPNGFWACSLLSGAAIGSSPPLGSSSGHGRVRHSTHRSRIRTVICKVNGATVAAPLGIISHDVASSPTRRDANANIGSIPRLPQQLTKIKNTDKASPRTDH